MTANETLRANLLALVRSLVPSGVDVIEARLPEAWFALNPRGGSAVVVAYGGKPKRTEGPVSTRVRQNYVFRFSVAITGENWASPAGASYDAANLAEILFGSPMLPPATPCLRNQSIGTISGEAVYLRFVDEVMAAAPNSTAEGGRFAIIQTWETNEVSM